MRFRPLNSKQPYQLSRTCGALRRHADSLLLIRQSERHRRRCGRPSHQHGRWLSLEFGGATWRDSETLYLCGEFSDSSEKHLAIQEEMHRQTSGYAAKRFIKTKYKSHMRQDFADFRIQWMLYVVWQKCKGNTEFANKLTLIPQNAVIIENTTKERCDTKEVWGCSNKALTDRRDELEKEVVARAKAENPNIKKAALERLVIKETCKVNDIGVFVGENNLGKILMICRECLVQGTEPPIDYALLDSKNIHLLGKRLTFA